MISTQAIQTQAYLPTSTHGIAPAGTTPPDDMIVFAELGQNRTVTAVLIISLSVLVAGIIRFGRRKEE
jgi:hypothetical protein